MIEKDIRDFFFKAKENYNLVAGQKELNIDGLRIDIFAVDKQGNPFIIEFKKDKNRHIIGQSAQYLALIPTKQQEIERKLNFFNINWDNLKVLCIAKSFNQRDFEALKFEPIKGRVFLYEYKVLKDYREKSIFGLEIIYKGDDEKSPLVIPEKDINHFDFIEHFEKINTIEGKENKRQYYTNSILPLLNEVAEELRTKYAEKKLYPHISYFNGHVLFRLGLDKNKSHRASIAITIGKGYIISGFDLTHSLIDAKKLEIAFKENSDDIASKLLSYKEYLLHIPNSGIRIYIPIHRMELKGIKLLLENYNPKLSKDCYIDITKEYEGTELHKDDLINLFDIEYKNFSFLFDEINNH